MKILWVLLAAPLSAAALFFITKVIGRKQLSQLDLFDYVTGITIGSIAAELATELEEPMRPLLALAAWAVISVALSLIGNKSNRSRRFINGSPVMLMKGGRLIRENFARCRLDLSEFLMMARQAGYFDVGEIDSAVAEYNGKVSFLPKAEKKPLCPADTGAAAQKAEVYRAVILDGEIMRETLGSLGFDEVWLKRRLDEMKAPGVGEIFLAVCSESGETEVYPK